MRFPVIRETLHGFMEKKKLYVSYSWIFIAAEFIAPVLLLHLTVPRRNSPPEEPWLQEKHTNSFFKCLDGEFKVRERRSGCVNSEFIELCHFPLASPWMDARKTPSKIDLYDVRRRPWWEKRSRLSSVSVQWGLISLCVFLRQKKKHVCWKRFSQHHDLATFSKYSHYFLVEMGFKGL